MRPPDYLIIEQEARRRTLANIRHTANLFRTPWGGTAPPPAMRSLLIQQDARLAAPAAGVVLALPEVLGAAPLGRIIYALASGKPLEEVKREYFQRLYQGSVWQTAGYDVDKMRKDVASGSLLAAAAFAPGTAAAGRRALAEALKQFAIGGAVTAGVTTPTAALQGRPPSEVGQIALESFLAGGSLADIAALGRKALADRLKTLQAREDVLNFVKRVGGGQAANEFLLRYNAELDAFRAEANKLPTSELLKLRDRYVNALKEFEANKIWRLDESVWKIRDKLDVIDEIIRSRPTATSDIIDLQYAASLAPPGPPPKPKPPDEIKDLLKKIGRARLEDLVKLEMADVPAEWRRAVDAAIQKRLEALKARSVRAKIEGAKSLEELANIERQLPDNKLRELEDLIQRKVMELKTGIPRGGEGPRVRVELRKEPPQPQPPPGGRAESPRRGGQVLELLTREEQTQRAAPKLRSGPVQRVESRVAKAENKPKDEPSVKPDEQKSEDGMQVRTDEGSSTKTEAKTKQETETETKTEQEPTVAAAASREPLATKTAVEADAAPVRVDAVPANAVLYTVTPTAMVYRAGNTFYAVLKSGDILMYPPGKPPPGVGGGGGGGWVPWVREGRARRLRGEKMRVY